MKSPIKPLGNRAVVFVKESLEEKRSGIIIPKAKDDSILVGKVIAVGEGEKKEVGSVIMTVEPDVSVGDNVVFSWGEKIDIKEKTYHIVQCDSILGILTDDK